MSQSEYGKGSLATAGLGQKTAVAFSWGIFANGLKIVLTLVVQGVMARYLGPNAFGLFAMGIIVMGLAGYFADMGISTRLVQQREVNKDDIAFALAINIVMSMTIALLVIFTSDYLAAFFGTPDASLVFKTMAPVFVINAIASVSISLLRRELDYRTIQLASLGSYVVGFAIIGLLCAVFIESSHALIAAYVTQALVNFLMVYSKVRHSFRLNFSFKQRGDHLSFGGMVLVTNIINWCGGSIDKIIVGKAFSAQSLGHYSAAYNLIFAPIGALYQNLQSTVFSSMARMNEDKQRMREAYLELVKVVSLLVLPAFSCAYVVAPTLVLAVYGASWIESGDFAKLFCLIAPLQLIWGISTPVLWNAGRRTIEAKVQLPFIIASALSMIIAANYSSIAVAQIAALAFALRTTTMMVLACQTLSINTRQLYLTIFPSLVMSACVFAIAYVLAAQLKSMSIAPIASLAIVGFVFFLTMLIGTLLAPSLIPRSVSTIILRISTNAPKWTLPIIQRLTSSGV
jgi:O-antigen/teichoic acid export membrane protein